MTSRTQILCPAKINTFLAVGPADHRGWHPLKSIFQAVSLYDVLHVEVASEDNVTFSIPGIPDENTITKAIRLMREIADFPYLKIHVEKHIPAESGLGGGSSDAAGILRHIRNLLGTDAFDGAIQSIAAKVGSDVPFFLVGGRAKAEGYGEMLSPLPDVEPYSLVIARPNVGCSTPDMYRRLDEKSYPWAPFPDGDVLYNDFERVAPCECLDLIERLQMLGAEDAGLSGSGSAVFGRFQKQSEAENCQVRLGDFFSVCVTALNRVDSFR